MDPNAHRTGKLETTSVAAPCAKGPQRIQIFKLDLAIDSAGPKNPAPSRHAQERMDIALPRQDKFLGLALSNGPHKAWQLFPEALRSNSLGFREMAG